MSIVMESQPATVPSGGGKARSIDELIHTVSASRLSAFHQCRLKFFFRYVLGLVKPKSPALHVGSSVHATLKQWSKARWMGEALSLKQLHDVYAGAWDDGMESEPVEWNGDSEDEEKKTGWRLLETYFRESPIMPEEKPEAVEVSVEADLGQPGLPKLMGIIDLVRSGGRIVDFKTSGKTPDPSMVGHLNDTQLSCYGLLYRNATGKRESGLELHYLIKTKTPMVMVTSLPPVNDVQEQRLLCVMESYVDGVQSHDWVPSPSFLCASCEYFNECQRWSGKPKS